jgi:hypothetical protein
LAYVGVGVFAVPLAVFLFSNFAGQTVSFAYQSRACAISPQLFPGLFQPDSTSEFLVERDSSLSFGKFAIYSHFACLSPQSAPKADTAYVAYESLLGNGLVKKNYTVKTSLYPELAHLTLSAKAIPTDEPVRFSLAATDETFSYVLKANKKNSVCTTQDVGLSCPTDQLGFKHEKTYDLALVREFKQEHVGEVLSSTVKTLTPVKISKSSVKSGSTVYSKPKKITLSTNKQLQSAGSVKVLRKKSDGDVELAASTKISGKNLVITLEKDLPRRSKIELRIGELRATDKSNLAKTYTLPFSTSGGPKVAWINIGSRSVGFHQDIVVSFDQAIRENQNLGKIVSLKIGGKKHPVSLASSGDYIVISPSSPLPRCAAFTIELTSKLQSKYKVSGDSKWSYNSRAQCYTTFGIGTSVQGQGIIGYKFGGGNSTVLYVGAMHGDEGNSKHILDEWINELEANPGRIPSGRTIVVLPLINPDGYSAGTRTNARNVDLNRNFPANNWKSDVVMPSGKTLKNGGGKTPLSEPESKALASYVQSSAPKLTLTYHSQGAVVIANESGNSVSIGKEYGSLSGYGFMTNSSLDGFFPHDTTGAFEDWMHDKLGRSALIIELSNRTNSDFWRNRDAMWHAATH